MADTGNQFDVCIIGGSIAGNYLGYLLSKTNLNTVIIEEHAKIGVPLQCAGVISQKLGKLIRLPNDVVKNRVKVAKLIAPSGKSIRLQGDEQPYIVDRPSLDRHFYQKAKLQNNIHYLLGEKFKNFKYIVVNGENFVQISTSKRELISKILVGCDGPLSLVAQKLGIKNTVLKALQIRVEAKFNQEQAVMIFNPKWNELFGWIVPEGGKIFRVGIASKENIRSNLNELLVMLGVDFEKKLDFQGGLIPYGLMNKLSHDNILLLGDAAGQVKATTGGGVVMLLTAAKIAFSCIKKCFVAQNFSKRIIKKFYERACRKAIGKSLKFHYLLRLFLENFTDFEYTKLFSIVKSSKVEEILFLYGDMDFPVKAILKLVKNYYVLRFLISVLIKNPKLVFKMAKVFLR